MKSAALADTLHLPLHVRYPRPCWHRLVASLGPCAIFASGASAMAAPGTETCTGGTAGAEGALALLLFRTFAESPRSSRGSAVGEGVVGTTSLPAFAQIAEGLSAKDELSLH